MAPGFLNSLRRRSRASFRTDVSVGNSSDGVASQNATPSSGSLTPPSISRSSDPAIHMQVKESGSRRSILPNSSANSSRYSVSGMTGLGSPSSLGDKSNAPPLSQYAPRIYNANENAWVYQRVILLYGKIGDSLPFPVDGTVTVSRFDESVPPVQWPVCESQFKVLVYLQPGPNKIRFDFSSPKIASESTNHIHSSYLTLHMVPQLSTAPLDLAILVAKDSQELFDSTPARSDRDRRCLDAAVRKFRTAAYLWQAFTAEQMWRNNLGRRAFRFEEEWSQGAISLRDLAEGTMRSEARVHIIRSDKTIAELHTMTTSQQCGTDVTKDELYKTTEDAVRSYFNISAGQKRYVAAMILDSRWDASKNLILGHTAQAHSTTDLQLAVFGSQYLYSYPSAFEEVVAAFTDCTPTDTRFVANVDNECGSAWEAANMGIGGHLHEIGRLFGCPTQEEGIMLRDYLVLNRTFVPREAYSTRTKSKGGLARIGDECNWHRLDCLRFRSHPAFRLPCDARPGADSSVQAFAADVGDVIVTAPTGISFVEIHDDVEAVCHAWIEFPPEGPAAKRQVTLSEKDMRARLGDASSKGRFRLSIASHAGGRLEIADFGSFSSKRNSFKLDSGKRASLSMPIGPGFCSSEQEIEKLVLRSSTRTDIALIRVVLYWSPLLSGIEFAYNDGSVQLFGRKDCTGDQDSVTFDIRHGECLAGFVLYAGDTVHGIQVLTSLGKKSKVFGSEGAGEAHSIVPPRGFRICGIAATCGKGLSNFQVMVQR